MSESHCRGCSGHGRTGDSPCDGIHVPDVLDVAMNYRGVRDPCPKCHGMGTHLYPSTAVWRGGIGGAAMTMGVCDGCWGSGDEFRKGEDLRKREHEEADRVAARAAAYVFGDLEDWKQIRPGIEEVCQELEKLNNPRARKKRANGFSTTLTILVKRLRKVIASE